MTVTVRQLEVLHMTASDVILLIKRRNHYGSSDCRNVSRALVMRLVREGMLQYNSRHDDAADGFNLTEAGKTYVTEHPLR